MLSSLGRGEWWPSEVALAEFGADPGKLGLDRSGVQDVDEGAPASQPAVARCR